MSKAALTAKYRPQTFGELAGQDTLKAILSRAALEDRIAPAYLFSGTRGVGKTTIARIFAKALNCRTAPTAEPCNQCDQCRGITQGSAVDVIEIDGASNRGIDDVRRLKESVGYAPLEGRYKVFIIDEAHMLSREAFNALLKTLEEPPARVTFVLATTEPHKFPVTIISRCQHYVFKRLSQAELEAHLISILTREGLAFEPAAVRIIARRAAGSVRDSMSLLGQVLALGGDSLSENDVRSVLGLAGQELFFRLLGMVRNGATLQLSGLVHEVLDQGLDLGFFLRELAATWRNLFMLKQMGAEALPVIDLPEVEAKALLQEAVQFDLAHTHAAWQMILEGQRRVLTSLEPALALELLLLNLALLPRLISLEQFASAQKKNSLTGKDSQVPDKNITDSTAEGSIAQQYGAVASAVTNESHAPSVAPVFSQSEKTEDLKTVQVNSDGQNAPELYEQQNPSEIFESPESAEQIANTSNPEKSINIPQDWAEFLQFYTRQQESPGGLSPLLRSVAGVWNEEGIRLVPEDAFVASRLEKQEIKAELQRLLQDFCGYLPQLVILPAAKKYKTQKELLEEARDNPQVKLLEECFSASLIDCGMNKKTL